MERLNGGLYVGAPPGCGKPSRLTPSVVQLRWSAAAQQGWEGPQVCETQGASSPAPALCRSRPLLPGCFTAACAGLCLLFSYALRSEATCVLVIMLSPAPGILPDVHRDTLSCPGVGRVMSYVQPQAAWPRCSHTDLPTAFRPPFPSPEPQWNRALALGCGAPCPWQSRGPSPTPAWCTAAATCSWSHQPSPSSDANPWA